MEVSTGLVVTRQVAITGQKGCGKTGSLGKKKRGKRGMKYYKTIITCCLKSIGHWKQPCL